MAGDRPTRRRLLRSVAGIGLGTGAGGCLGIGGRGGSEPTGSDTDRPTTKARSTPGTSAATGRTTTEEPSSETPVGSAENASDGASPGTGTASHGSTERGAYTVGMYTDLYFDPIGLFVKPGTTVSFELVSGVHSATAYHRNNPRALNRRVPSGAPSWNTGQFGEEGAFRNVTFETRGTHDYYCIPHKYRMIGRIVVGEPGGPATESPNPDGELPDSERIVEEEVIPYAAFQGDGR